MAADEKDLVSGVNGEARRRFAGREGPSVFDLQCFRVELDQGTLVLEIDEDFALAVGHAEFRAAAKRERADEFSRSGVDGRGGIGITIKGKNALGEGIVDDRVGIFVRLDSVEDFERGEIEHDGIGVASVGGESFVEFIGKSNAVGSLGIWNITDDFTLIGIHDDVARTAGDEQAVSGGIHFEIVPASGSPEFHLSDEMVAGAAGSLGSSWNSREERENEKREESASDYFLLWHETPPRVKNGIR